MNPRTRQRLKAHRERKRNIAARQPASLPWPSLLDYAGLLPSGPLDEEMRELIYGADEGLDWDRAFALANIDTRPL